MFMSYSEKLKRVDIKTQMTTEILNECEICSLEGTSSWFNETDLAVHRKDMHYEYIMKQMSKHADRFCTICMNLFDSWEELQQHIRYRHLLSSTTARHIERDVFMCDVCDHIFFSKDVLEVHMMHFHLLSLQEKKWKTFVCPKCLKICKIQTLWHHLQHHNIPSLTTCDICLNTFKSTEDLMNHTKDHPPQLKCEICNFHTTKDTIFETHLDKHTNNANRKTITKKIKGQLLAELKRKEKRTPKFNIHHVFKGLQLPPFMHLCVMCKQISDTKEEVIEHILRDHTAILEQEVKPTYLCTCGANYHSRVLLKHHVFKAKGDHAEAIDQSNHNKLNLPKLQDTEMAMIAQNDNIEVIPIYVEQVPVKYETSSVQVVEMAAKSNDKVKMAAKTKRQVIKMQVDDQVAQMKSEAEYEILGEENNDGKQIVYVYAENNDDQLVTIDQNSEQEIISF